MIDKFEILLALSREKHFGKAAEACGITQPSLSSALKTIEEQLGVRIVERGVRFHGFTSEGERVLDWARRIVGDTRAMKQELAALKKGLTGSLRLGVIPTALPFVPGLTKSYMDRYTNVKISVTSMTSDAILEQLDNLEIDVGISYVDTEPLPKFQIINLYDEHYSLLVAPNHPVASRPSMSWEEAGRLPLCLLTPNMQNRRIIDRHLKDAGHQPHVVFESNSMTLLNIHVLSGQWATIAAIGVGESFDPPYGLKTIPIIEPPVTHRIGVIFKSKEPYAPIIAAFLSLIKKSAKQGILVKS